MVQDAQVVIGCVTHLYRERGPMLKPNASTLIFYYVDNHKQHSTSFVYSVNGWTPYCSRYEYLGCWNRADMDMLIVLIQFTIMQVVPWPLYKNKTIARTIHSYIALTEKIRCTLQTLSELMHIIIKLAQHMPPTENASCFRAVSNVQ
jgi:hypothetical protein